MRYPENINIRMTTEEKLVLENKAKEYGMTLAQLVRTILSQVKSIEINTKIEMK
jgi:antitoxin component of RelBE/YafQ-DinJ toxin-antitoxin module